VEQFGAGPVGTMLLADMGAEVIKIENHDVGGDSARPVPPYPLPENDSYYFQSLNRNKKSIALNIRAPEGLAVFHKLVARADVVFASCRGTDPVKLGLTYKQLGPINEKVVCCFLTGFGMTGPRAAEPAYDFLLQAYAGIMSMAGEPGEPPAKAGVSFVDYSGGFLAMLGMMTALWEVQRTGKGRDVDVALMDGAALQLAYQAAWTMNCGYETQKFPHSAHASVIPAQNFETKDGWITIFCGKQRFYEILVERMGRPELAVDEDFATPQARFDNREEILSILAAEFRQRTKAEWAETL